MSNQLNWRFLVKFALGTLVVTAVVHSIHMLQMGRLLEHLKKQAEVNATAGDLDRSALYYNRYVNYRPEDLEAKADYGLVLYRQSRTNAQRWRAYRLLQDVIQRNPQMDRIRWPLADLAVALGQHAEGSEFLKPLRGTVAERSELEQALAWCYIGAGRDQDAEQAFQWAIEYGPQRPEPYLQLAALYRRKHQDALSNQTLQRLVDANPRSASVYRARAHEYIKLGRLEQAAADLAVAVKLDPKDVSLWVQSAEVARIREWIEESRQILDNGLIAHPHQPRLMQFRAWLEMDNDRIAAGQKVLDEAIEHNPTDVELLALRAEIAFEQNQRDEAKRALEALRKHQNDGPLVEYLTARQMTADGDWLQASRQLEKSTTDLAGQPAWQSRAWLVLARCYEVCGDDVRRLTALQRAVQSDPASRQTRVALARLCAERGDFESARNLLQPIQNSSAPLPAAWSLLAQVLIRQNERKLSLGAKDVKWDDAEKALDKAREAANSAEVQLWTAQMWQVRNDAAQANDLLQKANREYPQDIHTWVALVDRALIKGDSAEAHRLLNEAEKKLGDRTAFRLARARWFAHRAQVAEGSRARANALLAKQLLDLSDDMERLPQAEHSTLFAGLSEHLQRVGAAKELTTLAERWIKKQPYHLGGPIVLFDLALFHKEARAVDQTLTQIKQLEGEEGVQWRCGRALWLILNSPEGDKSALAQARRLLQEASFRQPNWARLALTQARLADLEGKTTDAIRFYQQAFDNGERAPWVTERLVRLLVDRGRPVDADRVLRVFQQDQTPTPGLARLGADLARQRGEGARARDLARLAVSPDSTDYRDHLWLAEMQELGGSREEARATLERLLKVASDTPEAWVAMVRHQARGDQRQQAKATMEQAKKKLPAEQHDWLLAQCYEDLGELTQAEEAYRRVIAATPGEAVLYERLAKLLLYQDEPGRAFPLLTWLADVRNQAPKATIHWARRTLALASVGLLAPEPNLQANSEQQQTALRLLELNRADPADELADQRTHLFLELLDPTKRKAALLALEATQSQAPFTPDEQYRLALLYGVFGEPSHSRDLLLSLMATHDRNGQYLAAYTRLMISQVNTPEAKRRFSQLQKVEPESRRTEALKKQLAL